MAPSGEPHAATDPRVHLALLQHPVVQARVALRALGSIADPLLALATELRARTEPGARVLSPFSGIGAPETALAAALPDRRVTGIDPDAGLVEVARAGAGSLANLDFQVGEPESALPRAEFDAVVGLGSLHRSQDPPALWRRLHASLRGPRVVLAQEYVGPSRLAWPASQCDAASRALDAFVPPPLRPHHGHVDAGTAAPLRGGAAPVAPRSEELVSSCVAAGFRIEGRAGGGCALLLPVLLLQIEAYDVTRWDHSLVLAELCREEDRLMRSGALGDDLVMFVATAT